MRCSFLFVSLLVLTGCDAAEERSATAQPEAISYDGVARVADGGEALIERGIRLARVLGCRGCHKRTLQGAQFAKDMVPDFYASNLTRAVPGMTDAELEEVIRGGVHPDRGDLWLMPSQYYRHLSDVDLAAIIAYLRSVEPAGDPTPPPDIPDDLQHFARQEGIGPATVAIEASREQMPIDLGGGHAQGRYIAITACAECHGSDLGGTEGWAPDLAIAGSYDRDGLAQMLTTGEALGGRDIGLMGVMATERFSQFTDTERMALIDYLLARAAALPPE